MVHSRGDENSIVRRLVERTFHLGAAAAAILASSLILGVLSHRCLQVSSRNTHVLGHFVEILALDDHTRHLNVAFNSLQRLANVIVKEHVGVAGGLLQDSGRHGITRVEFVEEALAFLVDQHSTVATDGFGHHHAGRFNNRRVGLDLVHVNKGSLDLFGEQQAVARGTRMVRRGKALQTRNDLGNHSVVAGKAACCVHNSLGVDFVDLAVFVLNLDAGHSTVLDNQVDNLRVRAQINLAGFNSVIERLDNFRTNSGAARRTVATLVGGAAHKADVVEVTAELDQPLNSIVGVFAQNLHEFRIVAVVAALHRVLVHLFDAVLNAELCLLRRFSSVDTAGSADRVTADHRHLFDDHNLLDAVVVRLNGSSHTSTACTDHDNVSLFGSVGHAEGGSDCGCDKNLFHVCCLPNKDCRFLFESICGFLSTTAFSTFCAQATRRRKKGRTQPERLYGETSKAPVQTFGCPYPTSFLFD